MDKGIRYIKTLEAAGISREHAEAQLEGMADILANLVTREQFATANLEVRTDFAKLRAEFAELRIEFAEVQKAVSTLASEIGSIENRLLVKQAGLTVMMLTAYALAKNTFHF